MKVKKEFKIGLLVLVALGFFIFGFQFLKGNSIFSPGEKYYGVYSNMNNLSADAAVFYNGFKVGSVDKVALHPKEKGKFVIAFSITEKIFIPKNSVAQIFNSDIMGSKAIDLIMGDSSESLMPGDTIMTSIKDDMFDTVFNEIEPLKGTVVTLLRNLDAVLTDLHQLFNEENASIISDALLSFNVVANEFEDISKKIGGSLKENGELANSIKSIEEITKNFAEISSSINNQDLANILSNTDSTMAILYETIKDIESANGTIGKLINDEELYTNLADASNNLDRLLEDIRLNPKKYVHLSAFNFGKKVYLITNEEIAKEKEITFKLNLKSLPNQQTDFANSVVENYKVEVMMFNNAYNYIIGNSYSYVEIDNLKKKLDREFPNSEIFAFEKGKKIDLEKALKKVKL